MNYIYNNGGYDSNGIPGHIMSNDGDVYNNWNPANNYNHMMSGGGNCWNHGNHIMSSGGNRNDTRNRSMMTVPSHHWNPGAFGCGNMNVMNGGNRSHGYQHHDGSGVDVSLSDTSSFPHDKETQDELESKNSQ
jgi:hypothetical protein